jgi:hypothetical protein
LIGCPKTRHYDTIATEVGVNAMKSTQKRMTYTSLPKYYSNHAYNVVIKGDTGHNFNDEWGESLVKLHTIDLEKLASNHF